MVYSLRSATGREQHPSPSKRRRVQLEDDDNDTAKDSSSDTESNHVLDEDDLDSEDNGERQPSTSNGRRQQRGAQWSSESTGRSGGIRGLIHDFRNSPEVMHRDDYDSGDSFIDDEVDVLPVRKHNKKKSRTPKKRSESPKKRKSPSRRKTPQREASKRRSRTNSGKRRALIESSSSSRSSKEEDDTTRSSIEVITLSDDEVVDDDREAGTISIANSGSRSGESVSNSKSELGGSESGAKAGDPEPMETEKSDGDDDVADSMDVIKKSRRKKSGQFIASQENSENDDEDQKSVHENVDEPGPSRRTRSACRSRILNKEKLDDERSIDSFSDVFDDSDKEMNWESDSDIPRCELDSDDLDDGISQKGDNVDGGARAKVNAKKLYKPDREKVYLHTEFVRNAERVETESSLLFESMFSIHLTPFTRRHTRPSQEMRANELEVEVATRMMDTFLHSDATGAFKGLLKKLQHGDITVDQFNSAKVEFTMRTAMTDYRSVAFTLRLPEAACLIRRERSLMSLMRKFFDVDHPLYQMYKYEDELPYAVRQRTRRFVALLWLGVHRVAMNVSEVMAFGELDAVLVRVADDPASLQKDPIMGDRWLTFAQRLRRDGLIEFTKQLDD